MTRSDQPGSPNGNLLLACLFGAFGLLLFPDHDSYFGQVWLFIAVTGAGLIAGSKGAYSIRKRYRWRVARAQAEAPSTRLGGATFASLADRLSAKVHDLGSPIFVGLSDTIPTFIPKGRHLAVESPTGGAKTSGIVVSTIWQAAQNGYSAYVQDAKPELAYLLGDALTKTGFRVVYNNPAGVGDFPHTDSNPFAGVVEALHQTDRPSDAVTIADALALSLIPEIKSDKNKFFRDLEADCLSFAIVALAALYPAQCYPAGVLRTLLDPTLFRDLCLTARQSDLLDGDLAALASSFLQIEINNPEHYSSAVSGAKNALRIFKKSSDFGNVGARHEFDSSELRTSDRPVVVFDIARPDTLDSFAKVNALTQTARLQSLRRHRNGRPVLLLCDESTTLPVPSVVKDLELMRSFNVTIALFYQSYSSLQRVYGEHNAKSILSSCVNIFMSVNDLERAKLLSERLGSRTVKTSSHNFAENGSPSSGVGEQAQPLLSPDEILSLPPETMLMTVPGIRPIKLTKAPYYHIEPFKSLVGENPHERHPPSPTTVLRLTYHNDPLSPRAPTVPDLDKRYAHARRMERTRNYTPRAKRFVAREFLWAPIAAVIGFAIFTLGTPHLLLQHSRTEWGQNACVYIGASGLRQIADPRTCESVRWIRFGGSAEILS